MGRLLRCWIVVPLLGASATTVDAQDWTPIGPPGGAMTSVAVDPDAPDTVYAIGGIGLFRSANAGSTWQRQPLTDPHSIAMASGGVIYIGGFNGTSYKSVDSGHTWQTLPGLQNQYLYTLAADSADALVVYAWTSEGVRKSGDGGATFAPPGDIAAAGLVAPSIALDPGAPDTLYALVPAIGVFKSTDGAATWQATGAGLPSGCGVAYQVGSPDGPVYHDCLLSLTVDPTSAQTLYVGTDGQGVYVSRDRGATWSALGAEIGDRAVAAVAVDPSPAHTLYAGVTAAHDPSTGEVIEPAGGPVYRSDDDGASWHEASSGLPVSPVSALAIDPRGSGIVYVATGGPGVYATRDGGATWRPAERGLNATCLGPVAAAGTTPTTLLTAKVSELPRLLVTSDTGANWLEPALEDSANDITSIAVDPSDPSTVYAATLSGGVLKSVDGARTWDRRDTGLGAVIELAVDPGSAMTLYASCGNCGVIKSTDGAATWLPANAGLPFISQVAVDDGTGTVYAAAEGVAFKSSDAGDTWVAIAPVPHALYGDLVVAPTTPATLFSSTFEGIYVSRDGGGSWNAVTLPGADTSRPAAYPLAVSPAHPSTVYTAVGHQLLRSDDVGMSWQPVGNPLDVAFPSDLVVDPNNPQVVYASTCGAGAFVLPQAAQATQGSVSGCAVGPSPRAPATAALVNLLVVGLLRLITLRRTARRGPTAGQRPHTRVPPCALREGAAPERGSPMSG